MTTTQYHVLKGTIVIPDEVTCYVNFIYVRSCTNIEKSLDNVRRLTFINKINTFTQLSCLTTGNIIHSSNTCIYQYLNNIRIMRI